MTAVEAENLRDWLHGWPTRATTLAKAVRREFYRSVARRDVYRTRRAHRILVEIADMLSAAGLSFDPAPELPEWARTAPAWRWTSGRLNPQLRWAVGE